MDYEQDMRRYVSGKLAQIEQGHIDRIQPYVKELCRLEMFGTMEFLKHPDGSYERIPPKYPPEIQKCRETLEGMLRASAEARDKDMQELLSNYPSFFARSSAVIP